MKKSLIKVFFSSSCVVIFSLWLTFSVAFAEEAKQQAIIDSAVNLVIRSGNDEKYISEALASLSPYSKSEVLEGMLSAYLQTPNPPLRRRKETAIRLLVLYSGNQFLDGVVGKLNQKNEPARAAILIRILSDLKYPDAAAVLQPYLDDTRISGELIGEERASGTALRVCDEAFNAIRKNQLSEGGRSRIGSSSLTSERNLEIQQLKARIESVRKKQNRE